VCSHDGWILVYRASRGLPLAGQIALEDDGEIIAEWLVTAVRTLAGTVMVANRK
jgi:hypothetical protein